MSTRDLEKGYTHRKGGDDATRVGKIIQPEAVGDEQSDQLLVDTSRKDLADGLPLVNADPFVPPVRRNSIKVVRSMCLVLVMLVTHVGLAALVVSVTFTEHEDFYPGVLQLDVCHNGSISEAAAPNQRRLDGSGGHTIYSPEAVEEESEPPAEGSPPSGLKPGGTDVQHSPVAALAVGGSLSTFEAEAHSSHHLPDGPLPANELPAGLAWTQMLMPSVGSDPLVGAPGWVHEMGSTAKKVTFHAVDQHGTERLPELVYFDSEDDRGMIGANLYMALSFGLLRMHPVHFKVTLTSDECLPNYIPGLRSLPPSSNVVDNFAEAALGGLAQGLRRKPQEEYEGLLPTYGALLLRKDKTEATGREGGRIPETAWDPEGEDFHVAYQPSWGVVLYVVLFIVVSIGLTVVTGIALAVKVYRTWKRSAADWIVQYDYLWLIAGKQIEAVSRKRTAAQSANRASASQATPAKHNPDEAVFTDAIQLCSPFFIMDNVVGDARACEEQWNLAIASSLVHGLTLSGFIVLPAITGLFVSALKAPFLLLAATNLCTGVVFGIFYYCSASFLKPLRRFTLYASFFSLSACMLWGMLYLNTVVVFMLTRLVATPAEVIALAVPVGTVWAYLLVAASRYEALQSHYQQVAASKQTKGKTWAVLAELGLSNTAIVLTIILEVCLMICVTALLLVVAALHASDPNRALANPVPAVILPIMTVVRAMQDLDAKKQAVDLGTKHLEHRFERDF